MPSLGTGWLHAEFVAEDYERFAEVELHMRSAMTSVMLLFLALPAEGSASSSDAALIDTDLVRVRVETIASGLDHPWSLAFLPDGRYLVIERNSGQLRIGTVGGELSEPVERIPDVFRYQGPDTLSQGGLFHVAVHPRFQENRLIYVSFSQPSSEGGGTAIVRGRLNEDDHAPRFEDAEIIFSMNVHDSSGTHFGGRFAFEPRTGNIILSIGDRNTMSRAQDPIDEAGSLIRITDTGDTPNDNPFVGQAGKGEKILSHGFRNVEGLAIDPRTGALWVTDQGPLGGDEINLIKPGRNYGWPIQTGGVDPSGAPIGRGAVVAGYEAAAHIWDRQVTPSGLVVYDGTQFPMWQGDLLHGSLHGRALLRTRISEGKVTVSETMLTNLDRRIRDVAIDSHGAIWLVTDHEDGEVLRLTPEDPVTTGTVIRRPGQ